jgi:hypothetical protein
LYKRRQIDSRVRAKDPSASVPAGDHIEILREPSPPRLEDVDLAAAFSGKIIRS